MPFGITIQVRGPAALFTRPEAKSERMSYSCPTPSAMRGLIESVYYHPGLTVRVDAITVLNRIEFSSIRRNEVGAVATLGSIKAAMKSGGAYGINPVESRQQRQTVFLQKVGYVVDFHFDLVPEKMNSGDSQEKFYNIFLRRLRGGQCGRTPYLGAREFPAYISIVEGERPASVYANTPEVDMGIMLYDMIYAPSAVTPAFFHAVMRYGVINTRDDPRREVSP